MADHRTTVRLANGKRLLFDALVGLHFDRFFSLPEVDPLAIDQILPVLNSLSVKVLVVQVDSGDSESQVASLADDKWHSCAADARNGVVGSIVAVHCLDLVPLRRNDVLKMRVVHKHRSARLGVLPRNGEDVAALD